MDNEKDLFIYTDLFFDCKFRGYKITKEEKKILEDSVKKYDDPNAANHAFGCIVRARLTKKINEDNERETKAQLSRSSDPEWPDYVRLCKKFMSTWRSKESLSKEVFDEWIKDEV